MMMMSFLLFILSLVVVFMSSFIYLRASIKKLHITATDTCLYYACCNVVCILYIMYVCTVYLPPP